MAEVMTDYVCPECRGDVAMDEEAGTYWCQADLVPWDLDELEAVTPDPVTGRVQRPLPGDVTYPDGWPSCGHSHCRQNWIDTGAHDVCVEDEMRLERERAEANECPEGCGRPAHPQGGPCSGCWHMHFDREEF